MYKSVVIDDMSASDLISTCDHVDMEDPLWLPLRTFPKPRHTRMARREITLSGYRQPSNARLLAQERAP